MEEPQAQYLHTERGAIAHQVFGEGGRTIVWSGPPIISIETRWDLPGNLQTWEFLSSLGRVVMFDYRGFGISEHMPPDRVAQMDELCFDLTTVLTELASPPNVLIATGFATMIAVAVAASHPEAVDRIVLLNAVAGPSGDSTEDEYERPALARDLWGTGALVSQRSGGVLTNEASRRRAARVERLSATPAVAETYTRVMRRHDVRPLLSSVAVPTLVVHTGDIGIVTPAMSEEVASAIPGAAYLVRPSSLFNWGEWDSDIRRFITGEEGEATGQRDLAAVVFTDVVGSTAHAARVGDASWRETLGLLDKLVEREVSGAQGRVVKHMGDGHLLEFARPGDALTCARRLIEGAPSVGVDIRAGVHFGEVERRPSGDLGGIAVHLAARIVAEAGAREILVSRTVAELTAGDGRTYQDRGSPPLKGIPGEWQLLALDPPGVQAGW